MTENRMALEILETVCKKGCAVKMKKELEQMKFGEDTAIDIMVEFFKPVKRELWGLHFGAFSSYLSFLMSKNLTTQQGK